MWNVDTEDILNARVLFSIIHIIWSSKNKQKDQEEISCYRV